LPATFEIYGLINKQFSYVIEAKVTSPSMPRFGQCASVSPQESRLIALLATFSNPKLIDENSLHSQVEVILMKEDSEEHSWKDIEVNPLNRMKSPMHNIHYLQ
jgi:hypothetical protein